MLLVITYCSTLCTRAKFSLNSCPLEIIEYAVITLEFGVQAEDMSYYVFQFWIELPLLGMFYLLLHFNYS